MIPGSQSWISTVNPRFVWLAVLLALTGAEIAIAVDGVRVAVVLLIMTLLLLVWYAGEALFVARTFALTLTLVPLLHVLSLGLPLERLSSYFWSFLVCVPAFAAVTVVIRQLGFAPSELSLAMERIPQQTVVGLLGIPIGGVVFLLLRPSYPLAETPVESVIAVLSLCLAGVLDEVIFRGVLQETALVALGERGVIYTSALYAILQIETRSLTTVIVAFIMSMGFAWYVRRTRTVVGVAVMHSLANVVVYLVLPMIVRGGGQ